MICKICNKKISDKGFGSHLITHQLTAKNYYNKFIKKENEGISEKSNTLKDTIETFNI